MTNASMPYKKMNKDGHYSSHDRVDHSKNEYRRHEEGQAIHTIR